MGSQPDAQAPLETQIKSLLGFLPQPRGLRVLGFDDLGWVYQGQAAAPCPRCGSHSNKHVWQQFDFGSWVVVCVTCGYSMSIGDFPEANDRTSLQKAEVQDTKFEPPQTMRVGLFCCGAAPEAVALVEYLKSQQALFGQATESSVNPTNDYPDNYQLVTEVFKLCNPGTASDGETLCAALKQLRPSLKELRRKYKNYKSRNIQIDYSGEIAEAYLLAYVPIYINQALKALRYAFERAGREQPLVSNSRNLNLEFHLFDRQNSDWTQAREALLRLGCDERWRGDVDIHPREFDLASSKSLVNHKEAISNLDLAMFQNFDNEIGNYSSASRQNVETTITEIAKNLRPGGRLIISDLYGSDRSQNEMLNLWENELRIGRGSQKKFGKETVHDQPSEPILTNCFFSSTTSGLKPKRYVELNVLAFDSF